MKNPPAITYSIIFLIALIKRHMKYQGINHPAKIATNKRKNTLSPTSHLFPGII
jgi:hypothetical protein